MKFTPEASACANDQLLPAGITFLKIPKLFLWLDPFPTPEGE
jgi:hypothetical protein